MIFILYFLTKENFFIMTTSSNDGLSLPNWSFNPSGKKIVDGLCKFNDNSIGSLFQNECNVVINGQINNVKNPAYLDYSDSFILTNLVPFNSVRNVCKVGNIYGTIRYPGDGDNKCEFTDGKTIMTSKNYLNLGIF